MKVIVVIGLEMDDPEGLPAALEHLNPPAIPHFNGQVRMAIDPVASQVIAWLDGDDSGTDDR